MNCLKYTRVVSLLLVVAGSQAARGQGRGGGHSGGMGMPGGGMRGGSIGLPHGEDMGMPGGGMNIPRGGSSPASRGSASGSVRGGLQLGPPGRWWDDKKFAKSLGLNGDQQKRMDGVFGQNRDALLSRYETLQRAEGRLEALTHSAKPSEEALFNEIDQVSQARADLEKANTHLLLQLRNEMNLEQIEKLEDHR